MIYYRLRISDSGGAGLGLVSILEDMEKRFERELCHAQASDSILVDCGTRIIPYREELERVLAMVQVALDYATMPGFDPGWRIVQLQDEIARLELRNDELHAQCDTCTAELSGRKEQIKELQQVNKQMRRERKLDQQILADPQAMYGRGVKPLRR
jgi:FtsZ-binding cell division protein ZapB